MVAIVASKKELFVGLPMGIFNWSNFQFNYLYAVLIKTINCISGFDASSRLEKSTSALSQITSSPTGEYLNATFQITIIT